MYKPYQCDSCKGFSPELSTYWHPYMPNNNVAAWRLCPKCVSRQVAPALTKEQAVAGLIARNLLNE